MPNDQATSPRPALPAERGERVYLVATGETHDGQETYTRHNVRPPLCDAETLYTASPNPIIANGVMALLGLFLMEAFIEEDERARWLAWLERRFEALPDDGMAVPLVDDMLAALRPQSAPTEAGGVAVPNDAFVAAYMAACAGRAPDHNEIGLHYFRAGAALAATPVAAVAQPVAESEWIEQTKHLNCPVCGGSGHVDDVAPKGDEARRALLELVMLKEMKDKWEAEELSGFAYKSTDNHRLHNEQRADYLRRQPVAWESARTALAASPSCERQDGGVDRG